MRIRLRDILIYTVIPMFLLGFAFVAVQMVLEGNYLAFGILGFYFVIFSVLTIGFLNLDRRLRSRLDVELGREPVFEKISSGQLGIVWYRNFLRITLYEGLLVIRAYDAAVLMSEDIDYLEAKQFLIFSRLQIYHHNKSAPQPIVIHTLGVKNLKALIELHLHLKETPNYGKEPDKKKVKTGKKEFWPWLKN